MISVQKQVTGIGTVYSAVVDEKTPDGDITFVCESTDNKQYRCPYQILANITKGMLEYYDEKENEELAIKEMQEAFERNKNAVHGN